MIDPIYIVCCGYIPIWVAIFIIIYCNALTLINIHQLFYKSNTEEAVVSRRLSQKTKLLLFRLIALPAMFIVLTVPSSVYRLLKCVNYEYSHGGLFELEIIVAILTPIKGFVDAIIYVLSDQDVRKDWKEYFIRFTSNGDVSFRETAFSGPPSIISNRISFNSAMDIRNTRESEMIDSVATSNPIRESKL